MDNRRLILAVVLGLALVMLWQPLILWVGRQLGYDLSIKPATQPTSLTPSGPIDASTPATGPSSFPTTFTASTGPEARPGVWRVAQVASPATMPTTAAAMAGSGQLKDKDFNIQVVATPRGAGIASVVLNQYLHSIYDKKRPFHYEEINSLGTDADRGRPLSTQSLKIADATLDLSAVNWTPIPTPGDVAVPAGAQSITYRIEATDGPRTLQIDKTYVVRRSDTIDSIGTDQLSKEDSSQGYEVEVVHTIRNVSDREVGDVRLTFNGPIPPPSEAERYIDTFFLGGLFDSGRRLTVESHGATSLTKDAVDLIKSPDGKRPLWIAATTTYFNAILRPVPVGKEEGWWEKAEALALHPDKTNADRGTIVTVTTKPLVIRPGTTTLSMKAYFGPRKRELLANAYYSSPFAQYDRTLVITSGICAWCTFEPLIRLLYAILKFFHDYIVFDWGVAIILLVACVRLLLHPVAKFSQMQMLKMGKMGPELARLKEKYGDGTDEYKKAASQVMMQQGATPIFGCLPIFLQMPIWIALWQAMNTTFDLRHEPFFYGLTWISDLSKPDHLIDFHSFGWPVLSFPCCLMPISISGFNILPIIFGVLQYISFKIQPKPAAMTPEQEQQQKMTQWMILGMMPILLYASPSGLMIYMITSFLVGIWESKRIRREYDRREAEAEKFKTAPGQSLAPGKAVAPKKGLGKWLADLQARAEEMKKQVDQAQKNQTKRKQ